MGLVKEEVNIVTNLEILLAQVRDGKLSAEEAKEQIARFAFESHDIGTHDHLREIRTGIPEVIFSEGKSPEDIRTLFSEYLARKEQLIATRVSVELAEFLNVENNYYYHTDARILSIYAPEDSKEPYDIGVLSAGASDRFVTSEVEITASLLGISVLRIDDVGVAGLSRLTTQLPKLQELRLIIVVAGMDGALPSVLAGLVRQPIIAVPTSVGYGAAFDGLAALLAMLNSCAPGVSVVNIDNGFGAAVLAKKICQF